MIEFPASEPFYDDYGNVDSNHPWNDHELQFVTYANLMGAGHLVEVEGRSGVPLFLSPLYRVKIPVEMGEAVALCVDSIEFTRENESFGCVEAYVLFEAIVISAISSALIQSNITAHRRIIFEMLEDCIGLRPNLRPILDLINEWNL